MRRAIVITSIVGLLAGGLGGYGWRDMTARRAASDLQAAQQRTAALERELDKTQAQMRSVEGELQATTARLKELEQHLASEEERRSRLEGMLSRGKK
jgi:septal ring factor EnvC (AmiA/AmiB activator)